MPVSTLKNVDFPAPLGPINPVIDPGLIITETPSTARKDPKSFVRLRVSRMGVCASAIAVCAIKSLIVWLCVQIIFHDAAMAAISVTFQRKNFSSWSIRLVQNLV